MTVLETCPAPAPRRAALIQQRRRPPRTLIGGVARVVAIVLVVLAFLLPFAYMVTQSLKSPAEILDPSRTLNFAPTFDNFVRVFEQQDLLLYLTNSLIVAVASTIVSLAIGLPAAYAFSRYLMGKSIVIVLIARVVPGISLLLPWYYIFSQMRLVGTYSSLVLAHMFVSLPLIIWIMVAFFDGMSPELEEAGQVDGLSRAQTFLRITLPLAVPGVATAGVLSFIFSWNNFLFSLILAGNSTRTLPVAVFNFISYASVDWGGLMAASVVVTIPLLIIALLSQKYIVSGLTAGATKG